MHVKALFILAASVAVPLTAAPAQRSSTSGQGTAPLVRGARVRVRSNVLVAPLVANYLEVRADTLVLFEEGSGRGIWSLAFDQIQRLEASVGDRTMYRPYILKGAAIGGGIGVAAGFLFASAFSPSDPGKQYDRLLTASVGGLLGAGIGGLVGARRKAEQFTPIPLPRRVSLLPVGHGARLVVGY